MSVASIIRQAEEIYVDDNGQVITHSWLLPETAEIIYGGIASLLIFFALYKYALPMAKKAMAARTAKIQKELDDSAAAKAAADAEAVQIRQAKGDIEGERARLLADADLQVEQVLVDGRARLELEIAELHARADAEIAQLAARSGDELRAEITVLTADAAERLVAQHLDARVQNELIESFIAKVGAS
jgi:F0F1-type ATP synthase membrane subunit b/b'